METETSLKSSEMDLNFILLRENLEKSQHGSEQGTPGCRTSTPRAPDRFNCINNDSESNPELQSHVHIQNMMQNFLQNSDDARNDQQYIGHMNDEERSGNYFQHKYSSLSLEQRDRRNAYQRNYRASLSEEERERRKAYQRNYNATVRKAKIEIKRDHLNAYQRRYRSLLSEEEKQRRKEYQKKYNATIRKEKNAVKRDYLNEYQRKYRASLSEEGRQKRRDYQRNYLAALSMEERNRRKEYHRKYNATVRKSKFKFESNESETPNGEPGFLLPPHKMWLEDRFSETSSDESENGFKDRLKSERIDEVQRPNDVVSTQFASETDEKGYNVEECCVSLENNLPIGRTDAKTEKPLRNGIKNENHVYNNCWVTLIKQEY